MSERRQCPCGHWHISDEHRAKLQAAYERRENLKPGWRRVYGVQMPKFLADRVQPVAAELRRKLGYEYGGVEAAQEYARAQVKDWIIGR